MLSNTVFSSAGWLESANYSAWERVVAKDSLIGSELSACGPGWIGLLPTDLILFAPVERNLSQRLGAKREPSRFDPVPKRSLEMPEGTCTLGGAQQFLSNAVGCHGMRKVAHDRPFVKIKLIGKFQKQSVVTIRLAISHSCFCQSAKSGSS